MNTTLVHEHELIDLKREWQRREELRSGRSTSAKNASKKNGRVSARRIGIVPDNSTLLPSSNDLVFPPNPGLGQPNVTNHGGAIAPGVPVQVIFWGSVWQDAANSAFSTQFSNAVQTLLGGPYYSALRQYGAAQRPFVRGPALYVISPDPPASFDDGNVGDLIWNMIDQGIFSEPDDSGDRNLYVVIMPPGTSYGPGGALGAHIHPGDYDFPFDFDIAWAAWIGNSDLTTMTCAFGHEVAEAVNRSGRRCMVRRWERQ